MECCSDSFFDCLIVPLSFWNMITRICKIHCCIQLVLNWFNQWLASSPPTLLVDRMPVRGMAGRLTLELMVGMGNTNFTMVMPTVQSFRSAGWSGGRAARKDYGTRSFGCKRDLCPFQVSGGGGVRLAFSSFATAMARKLTTYVASRSSACPWDGR